MSIVSTIFISAIILNYIPVLNPILLLLSLYLSKFIPIISCKGGAILSTILLIISPMLYSGVNYGTIILGLYIGLMYRIIKKSLLNIISYNKYKRKYQNKYRNKLKKEKCNG